MDHPANIHLVDTLDEIREALAPILGHPVDKYSALELAVMARESIKGARMGAHDARNRIEDLEAKLNKLASL